MHSKVFKLQPLDAMSAMFSFPCMFSQSFTFEFCLIPATLFSTNCLYFLSAVFIHVRTTHESVRYTSELMVVNCCNALLTVFINLLRISASKSSCLGMLWLVSGATLPLSLQQSFWRIWIHLYILHRGRYKLHTRS